MMAMAVLHSALIAVALRAVVLLMVVIAIELMRSGFMLLALVLLLSVASLAVLLLLLAVVRAACCAVGVCVESDPVAPERHDVHRQVDPGEVVRGDDGELLVDGRLHAGHAHAGKPVADGGVGASGEGELDERDLHEEQPHVHGLRLGRRLGVAARPVLPEAGEHARWCSTSVSMRMAAGQPV